MSDASTLTAHPGADDAVSPELPFTYDAERQVFNSLLTEFREEVNRVDERRIARKHRVSVEERRKDPVNPLPDDETIIADKTIDRNVRQGIVPELEFITQSPTVLSFYDIENPKVNFEEFASYITDIFRMGEWQKPWLLIGDSRQVHGGSWFELIYSPNLPQQAEIEYIPREKLILPLRAKSTEGCERFAREYEVTKRQFKDLARKFKFNPAVVHEIEEQFKHKSDFIKVYKWFMRDNEGVFFIAWLSDQTVSSTLWLKDPEPHQMGIFKVETDPVTGRIAVTPEPVTSSPVYFIPIYAEEDETLLSIQGRAALDLPTQEAVTSVLSATVNGAVRAAGFYPWDQGTGRSEPLVNKAPILMKHGHVLKGNLDVFQPNWPNNIALSVVQQLSSRNSQESGQVDFAAMSRQDTAKRMTEINAAEKHANELSSVSMLLYSISIKPAFITWLKIIKSAVDLKRLNPPQQYLPFFQRISSPFLNITMSADITIVRRAQRSLKYLQHYALVAGTPYADPYYKTMLAEMFPEEFPEWSKAVGETDRFKQALAEFVKLIPQIPANALSTELFDALGAVLNGSVALLDPTQTAPDGTPV